MKAVNASEALHKATEERENPAQLAGDGKDGGKMPGTLASMEQGE